MSLEARDNFPCSVAEQPMTCGLLMTKRSPFFSYLINALVNLLEFLQRYTSKHIYIFILMTRHSGM
jgi:hypothetical protein